MRNLTRITILLLLQFTGINSFAKTTHCLQVVPTFEGQEISGEALQFMKVTLLTSNRSDSLILAPHSSCSALRDKHERFNGKYIWVGPSIPFKEVKIEHPDFATSVYPINTSDVDADSVDVFNKRHHILFHINTIQLEKECEEIEPHSIYFWSNLTPQKGVKCYQYIGVLLVDTLSPISTDNLLHKYPLTIRRVSDDKRILLLKLKDNELKDGKNSILKAIILDSLFVKDAGVVIDTSVITFISSFIKISCLPVKQIEKEKIEPISGLKSMSWQSGYIQANGLEWGAGLYRLKTGLGYDFLKLQEEIKDAQLEQKCKEHDELVALDLEYLELNTVNFSNSGGKDRGKKRVNNTERMTEIKKLEKEISVKYNAPIGYLDIILVEENFTKPVQK